MNGMFPIKRKQSVCLWQTYKITSITNRPLVDEAAQKAQKKQLTAQKAAECAEKTTRKKAKTAEITRRRNQENKCMYTFIYVMWTLTNNTPFSEPLAMTTTVHQNSVDASSVELDSLVRYIISFFFVCANMRLVYCAWCFCHVQGCNSTFESYSPKGCSSPSLAYLNEELCRQV